MPCWYSIKRSRRTQKKNGRVSCKVCCSNGSRKIFEKIGYDVSGANFDIQDPLGVENLHRWNFFWGVLTRRRSPYHSTEGGTRDCTVEGLLFEQSWAENLFRGP